MRSMQRTCSVFLAVHLKSSQYMHMHMHVHVHMPMHMSMNGA